MYFFSLHAHATHRQTITPVDPDSTTPDPVFVQPTYFKLGDPAVYYDIVTNATFVGPVEVCLSYLDGAFPAGASPRLYHYADGQWLDVTTSVDTVNLRVCGRVSSFSPFAVGYLIVSANALKVKSLRVLNKRGRAFRKAADTWLLRGFLTTGSAFNSSLILQSIATAGVVVEAYDRLDLMDALAFAPQDCRLRRSEAKPSVVCCVRTGTSVRHKSCANFEQAGAGSNLHVDAKLRHRTLNLTQPLSSSRSRFEVRIVTATVFGALASSPLRCKASSSGMRCKAT